MTERDFNYLSSSLEDFINAMLLRLKFNESKPLEGHITSADIKEATGRDRLAPSIIEEYIVFLKKFGINAHYDELTLSIHLTISSIFEVRLTAKQALDAAKLVYKE